MDTVLFGIGGGNRGEGFGKGVKWMERNWIMGKAKGKTRDEDWS